MLACLGDGCTARHCTLACSLLSSFFASLTLPMLPAPIVLPRIHFPDCVGIVVRDLALGWPEDRGSAEDGTAAGPVLCATVVAMAAGRGCGGWEDGWLARGCGCGREDDGLALVAEGALSLSLLVLLGCWWARLVRSCSCCGLGRT